MIHHDKYDKSLHFGFAWFMKMPNIIASCCAIVPGTWATLPSWLATSRSDWSTRGDGVMDVSFSYVLETIDDKLMGFGGFLTSLKPF